MAWGAESTEPSLQFYARARAIPGRWFNLIVIFINSAEGDK